MLISSQSNQAGLTLRMRLLGGALVFVLVVAGIRWWRLPAALPPVQPQLASLDPQVQDHLERMLAEVRLDLRNPGRRATLGIAFAANGLWKESRETFLQTAALAPEEPLARMYAAVALEEQADTVGALREYKALTIAFPQFSPGWYRLGESALRAGDLELSSTAFSRLVELERGEWRGPAGLGEIQLRRGDFVAAIPFLEEALRLDRSARPALFLLGQAYRAAGRTNESRLALAAGSGISRHPMPDPWAEEAPRHMKSLQDQMSQANELSSTGHPDQAAQLLKIALPFHPQHRGLLNQLAVVLNRSGLAGQALTLVNRLIEDDPKAVAPWITRSYTHVLLGHADRGNADALKAVGLAPEIAQTHLALANSFLALERDPAAVDALRAAIRCDPRNAEVYVELGELLWRNLGDTLAATAQFEQALELNPSMTRACLQLGLVRIERRDLEGAQRMLDTLQVVAPGGMELTTLRQALRSP